MLHHLNRATTNIDMLHVSLMQYNTYYLMKATFNPNNVRNTTETKNCFGVLGVLQEVTVMVTFNRYVLSNVALSRVFLIFVLHFVSFERDMLLQTML